MKPQGITAPLRTLLAGIARRIRVQTVIHGTLTIVLALGASVCIVFFLDWLFRLPFGVRLTLLLISTGILIRTLLFGFVRPLQVSLKPQSVALLIEQRKPELNRELITALQLEEALASPDYSESRELTEESIRRAVEHVKNTDIHGTIHGRPLRRPFGLAMLFLLIITTYTSMRPDHGSLFIDRCLLLRDVEWPARTKLQVEIIGEFRESTADDGHRIIHVPENTVLKVTVTAIGIAPTSIHLHRFSPESDGAAPIGILELSGVPGENTYLHNFGKLRASFGFYVVGGDDQNGEPYFEVNVRTAPKIASLRVDLDLPQYINDVGEPDREDSREFNIVAPEGTEVSMTFETSLPCRSFDLLIDGKGGSTTRLTPTTEGGNVYEYSLTLSGDHFYSWRIVGTNGAPGRDAPEFALSAQPDLPPDLNIIRPETPTIDVTTRGVVLLRFAVIDDFGVGEVAAAWDVTADGLFDNRLTFGVDETRELDGPRSIEVFRLLEAAAFQAPAESGQRNLVPGDQLLLRLHATDTRSTAANPKPNTVSYPSLLMLNIREEAEIERDLMRIQVRIKSDLERSLEACIIRDEELGSLIEMMAKEPDTNELLMAIHERLAAQELLTSSLAEAARSFVRVFDGFCFNRMDPSPLTEALINSLSSAHATRDGEHIDYLREILPSIRARIDDTESMGKIARIMDLLLTISGPDSAKITSLLSRSAEAKDVAEKARLLQMARESNNSLKNKITLILEKMEDWEDFQDVIQSLKDIIDLENGLWERMKRIAR